MSVNTLRDAIAAARWHSVILASRRRGPYLALNPPQTKPQTNAIDRLRTSFAASTPTPNTL